MTTETIYVLSGLAVAIGGFAWWGLVLRKGYLNGAIEIASLQQQLGNLHQAYGSLQQMWKEDREVHAQLSQQDLQHSKQQYAQILAWQEKASEQARESDALRLQLAEMESLSNFDELLEGMTAICQRRDIPYTIKELMACVTAYHSLRALFESAVLATAILNVLVAEYKSQALPLGWLAAELEFEERAFTIGRQKALDEDIALSFDPASDEEQDLYLRRKERLERPTSTFIE